MREKDRRDVLKGLAIGLPAVWIKPLVESVVLPAHAATSDACNCTLNTCDCDCDVTITSSSITPPSGPQGTTFSTTLDVQVNQASPCVVFSIRLVAPGSVDYGVVHEQCISPLSPGNISLVHGIQAVPSVAMAFPPGLYQVTWELRCNGIVQSDQRTFSLTG